MDTRKRLIVGALWIGVAALMAITLDPGLPSTIGDYVRLFVIVLALLLAAIYVFDPWDFS